MTTRIRLDTVYDKNINFLFGSGASYGLFPTLELGLVKEDNTYWSLEDLGRSFEASADLRYVPLFMHYYNSCIRPAQQFDLPSATPVGLQALANYRSFLETILRILQRRVNLPRRCNVFTTNYDGCFEHIGDQLIQESSIDFILNDGTRGFTRKYLQAQNFGASLHRTGVFDRHDTEVPQVNLIHLHGSIYWIAGTNGIEVNYSARPSPLLSKRQLDQLEPFSRALSTRGTAYDQLPTPRFSRHARDAFWTQYRKIPIVNPTDWKFHETVFDEHYYQMLRLLSYELEKPNAVLITFGFSFADKHILNLVRRSLSNPQLKVFICCFDAAARTLLAREFGSHPNVELVHLDNAPLDFSAFNSEVFSLETPAAPTNTADGGAVPPPTAVPAQ